MWSFVADDTAGHLCRFYASALGGYPSACLSKSGTPALALTGIVLVAAAILAGVLRSAWRR